MMLYHARSEFALRFGIVRAEAIGRAAPAMVRAFYQSKPLRPALS